MKLTPEQREQRQNNSLYDLQKLIDRIRSVRILTGEDPKNKEEIDKEITDLVNKLDKKHYEIFEEMTK